MAHFDGSIRRGGPRHSSRRSLTLQERILPLQMRAFRRVSFSVPRTQVSSNEIAITAWKVAVIDLFRRVWTEISQSEVQRGSTCIIRHTIQLVPIEVFSPRI